MVIITLPAYNEGPTLPTLLERIRESMEENAIDYRVIVVNDGSTDGTGDTLERMKDILPLTRIDHDAEDTGG